jgi:hypothetical protein
MEGDANSDDLDNHPVDLYTSSDPYDNKNVPSSWGTDELQLPGHIWLPCLIPWTANLFIELRGKSASEFGPVRDLVELLPGATRY